MTTYIIRRLLHAALVMLIVSLLVFLLMRLLPGDPILMYVASVTVVVSSLIVDILYGWLDPRIQYE